MNSYRKGNLIKNQNAHVLDKYQFDEPGYKEYSASEHTFDTKNVHGAQIEDDIVFEPIDESTHKKTYVETLKDKFDGTLIGMALTGLQHEFKHNRKLLYAQLVITIFVTLFLGITLSGFIYQFNHVEASFINKLAFNFTKLFGLNIIIYILLNVLCFYGYRMIKGDTVRDDRNYDMSKESIYGQAHWLNDRPDEFYQAYETVDDLEDTDKDILGQLKSGEYVSLKEDVVGINKNIMIVGSPGCGKSAAYVNNKVFQSIKRGESLIVTDSKGAIYADTAKQAIEAGYEIKIINLKSNELENSDGCNFLKYVGKSEAKITMLAKTIIKNTTDGNGDFWTDSEFNFLKAALTYVAYSQTIPEDQKTLGYVYNNILAKPLPEIARIFNALPEDHPARAPYIIFNNGSDKVKESTHSGLGIRLGILSNPIIQQIVGNDEIDLTAPGKRKCIYYVIIPDQEDTYNFIATLFFSLISISLVEYADSLVENDGKLPVAVNMVLDEFFSTGCIENFSKKVATVRSRNISIAIILQDIGQLIEMYGENIANSIMGGCSMKMLLATNDETTATYFSTIMGTQTIKVKNKRYVESVFDIFKIHTQFQITEGYGKRELMTVDELMNALDSNYLILIVSGKYPVMLKKFISKNHPMYNAEKNTKLVASDHIPEWRKREESKQLKIKAEADALRAKTQDAKAESTNQKQNNSKGKQKKKITAIKRRTADGGYILINKETGEVIKTVSPNTESANTETSNNNTGLGGGLQGRMRGL